MISCKEYAEIERERLKALDTSGKTLSIFQVGDNPASNSYIKGKLKDCKEVGINAKLYKYDENITQEELYNNVSEVAKESSGIIIQLPVPKHIDTDTIMKEVATPEQDVDGFVYDYHDPCTPKGIINWLEYNDINLDGKNVVIIGRSDIVGKPLAKMMVNRNATVTLCHSHTDEMAMRYFCKYADIIVVAVGKPKWFKCDSIAYKPIVIDVGINRDEDGKLCGDVDREYMEAKGFYVTPVPGGVGLLTRLALIQNTAE